MKKTVKYYSPMPSDSTSFYRASGVFPFIKSNEFNLVDISHITHFSWADFSGCDIFILQRPFTVEHLSLLTLAKDMGSKIIIDMDDDLWNVPQENPTHQMYMSSQDTLNACVGFADEVWVSTQSIKESALQVNKNVHVINNAWNDYMFPTANKKPFNPNTKKVTWRGGASHSADVLEIADDLLKTINENQDWTFTFMGDRFTYLEQRCGDNYQILPGMTIINYFKYIQQDNANIFIFPLVDNKFNQGKSFISWLEGTYAGSSFLGNTKLPEFNGDFVYNISDLNDVINYYPSSLSQNNECSWEYICDNLLLSKVNKQREGRILSHL